MAPQFPREQVSAMCRPKPPHTPCRYSRARGQGRCHHQTHGVPKALSIGQGWADTAVSLGLVDRTDGIRAERLADMGNVVVQADGRYIFYRFDDRSAPLLRTVFVRARVRSNSASIFSAHGAVLLALPANTQFNLGGRDCRGLRHRRRFPALSHQPRRRQPSVC